MKKYLLFTFLSFLSAPLLYGQINNIVEKFELPTSINETSGLIFYNGKLITHNDSYGANKLYELDTLSGLLTREVVITNAINTDWEDITQDANYIYIGDIGNNDGTRTDLKVYKIAKQDYDNSDSVTAQLISFSYAAQTDFTPSANNTVWDAEALVSYSDSCLLLFSKDWVGGITLAYLMPKDSGVYVLTPLPSSLNSEGLVAGATYNPYVNTLILIGYTKLLAPFVWESKAFFGADIFSGTNNKYMLTSLGMEQVEAVTYLDSNYYFASSELFNIAPFLETAKLIAFDINSEVLTTAQVLADDAVRLYPNPVVDVLHLELSEPVVLELINSVGKTMLHTTLTPTDKLDFSTFENGVYLLKMISTKKVVFRKIVKV